VILFSKAYAKPDAEKKGKALVMGMNRRPNTNFCQCSRTKIATYVNKTGWQPEALRGDESRMTKSEWPRLNSRLPGQALRTDR